MHLRIGVRTLGEKSGHTQSKDRPLDARCNIGVGSRARERLEVTHG